MKLALSLLITALLPWHSVVRAAPPFEDEFNSLNWKIWCPCQINMSKAPIVFTSDPDSSGNFFATIEANEASLGGNECRAGECRPPEGSNEFTLYGFDKEAPDLHAPDRP